MTLHSSSANAVLTDMRCLPRSQHRYYLRLKDPNDVYSIAQITASFFPNPEGVFTGVYELLLNAIEHGNLGLGSADKYMHIRTGTLLTEMERRLSLPEYADRTVEVEIIETTHSVTVSITDAGNGFDWKSQIYENHNDTRPHGRGLWIAQQSGFDRVHFNNKGNCVTCICYRQYMPRDSRH